MMKWTARRIVISLLALGFALGLPFLLASAWTAVAEPVSVTPLPPVVETDGRAGACFSYYPDPQTGTGRPFVQKALDVGSRWDRFDFAWPRLESADGYWPDKVLDGYDTLVDDLHGAGMNIVGILLWTPDWAATGGVRGLPLSSFDQRPFGWHAPGLRGALAPLAISASSSPPQGLGEEWDDWTAADGDPINYWGRFVHTVVSRYGDRVKHWEMWNEVDDGDWNYFWTGTEADYAQLLKVGYQATKAACPDCDVLYAGLLYWADTEYFRRVLGILDDDPDAPAHNYFFDIMSVHLYSRASNTHDEVNNIRSGMGVYDVADHPIWLTETGVPVWGDPQVDPKPKYDYAATQDEASAYVIQSYANALASDVGRYFFFRVHDHDMSEYFGLIRNDYSLRPAYIAYQVANTYLISPTFTTRVPTGSNVRATLWGTPRGKVSVLWNDSPTTDVYTLPAAIETAVLVDRWGVTESITATSGVYTFTLPGATAFITREVEPGVFERDYFIGGDPLIVIESETPSEPPTSTVHPLPEMTPALTFTVTWEGQDNQSGVWLYDVQSRDGADGGWTDWRHSTTLTSSQFTGQYGHTYYFRSRATDRIGNRAAWPQAPQAHTTLNLSSTLQVGVGTFFADENRNGLWDDPITGTNSLIFEEITLTQVSLRLFDGAGCDVVTPIVTSPWAFTTTIYYTGQPYRLWATSADDMYMRLVPITTTWARSGEVYTRTYDVLGLWPVTRVYLPLVLRERGT
jgi:hypothetical protein